MTEKLYEKDSCIKSFEATVIECEKGENGYEIVLDKTAFFPEGGGQPSDIGKIGNANCTDVQIIGEKIVHFCDSEVALGEKLFCELNWKRRFRHMQNHSGEHIISGLINKKFGFDNVGFHLGADEVTMDINGILSRQQLEEIEVLANEAVVKNAAFSVIFPKSEELSALNYRSKLDLSDNVRIVNIDGYDSCACCAPHVKSAGEIGIIKILDFFKMRDGIRIFIKCGFNALSDYNERYLNTQKISDLLSAKQGEVALAVEKQLETISELKFKNKELKRRFIDLKIASFIAEQKSSLIFEQDLDIKELQLFADGLYKSNGGIRGVLSPSENGFNFCICGEEKELDSVFSNLKTRLNIRGGGRNGMVQGSILEEKEKITSVFGEVL